MYLDSHVHFWQPSRGDYGWLKPENTLLYRDYLPTQLLQELEGLGVQGVIAVQAAPTAEEAEYLLQLSDRHPLITGVVGGLDPLAVDFASQLNRLAQHPRFLGIRVNGDRFEQPALVEHLRILQQLGLTLDVLAGPGHLTSVYECARQLTGLRIVVNHLGHPNTATLELWTAGMKQLAGLPDVSVKLSGMVTQVREERVERLTPVIRILLKEFGPSRLMFGSDWPVALQAGGYEEVVKLFEAVLHGNGLSPSELDMIRSRTAQRAYGLSQ
ncbi:amidohydrolase family protein [Paenibacillus roseipurpureus]|uniref:Amidohydrolase family protein n=1 Tax=Paenibacillus roseopurpureus TaxID=2918901 RepID=A0AA96LP90_9BACL|nr:amidohydrolase family protein [Paenibacillus sp. MBLB1832]WNR43464.1 amidohydrolase family protein [Paenibacillus sp. MBLB1832]